MDFSQIDALIEIAGREGVCEILQAFWRSTDSLASLLKTLLDEGNLVEAAKTAHAVKGSAANVGANLLASAARSLEVDCKSANFTEAAEALTRLLAAYEETRKALTAHVGAD